MPDVEWVDLTLDATDLHTNHKVCQEMNKILLLLMIGIMAP